MHMQTHHIGVIEILKGRLLYLHPLLVAVKDGDNEVEEVALPHVVRWLFLKLGC